MKKFVSLIIAFVLLVSICAAETKTYGSCLSQARAYKAEKNYIYALGSYYDALETMPEDGSAAYSEYSELVDLIKGGTLGYRQNQLVSIHDAWFSMFSNFEKYWTENCPIVIRIDDLQYKKVDYKKKTYTFVAKIDYDYSYKYLEMKEVLQSGLGVVYNEDWEVDEEWPLVALTQEKLSDYKRGGTALIRFGNVNYNAFCASVDGQTFFDFSLAVCDKNGKRLYASPSKIIGSGGSFILTGIPEDVAISIEDNDFTLKASSLNLIYGAPASIYTDSRSWMKNLPTSPYKADSVKVESSVEGTGTYDFNALSPYRKATLTKAEDSEKKENRTDINNGKRLNVYSPTSEVDDLFNSGDGAVILGDIEYCSTVVQSGDIYYDTLDLELAKNSSKDKDERIDLFVVDTAHLQKYIDAGYMQEVVGEVGISELQLSQQFEYAKQAATKDGKLMAVTWTNDASVFVYRRSIAKKVLGTDDPVKIQKQISDWKKFETVAAEMKKNGYTMTTNDEDLYRCFESQRKEPWVSGSKIVVNDCLKDWAQYTKKFIEKGYIEDRMSWGAEWFDSFSPDGNMFGIFGPWWFIEYVMKFSWNGTDSDWAVCEGPASCSWGGNYICVTKECDNMDLVKDLLVYATCSAESMRNYGLDAGGSWPNNIAATEKSASDESRRLNFLCGQNPYDVFIRAGKNVKSTAATAYDSTLKSIFYAEMKEFIWSGATYQEALDNFYMRVTEIFPELTR